jgi:hypothetical protein
MNFSTMKNKKSQIIQSGVGWVLAVIALVVVVLIAINLFNQGSDRFDIECNNYNGGKCVEREDECAGKGMITRRGMGCDKFCCFNASSMVKK